MFTQKIKIKTVSKKTLGDLHTPMNIYLKIRDKFRDTILLESSDSKSIDNNFSFIAINAIAGIEVKNLNEFEIKLPDSAPVKQFIMERNITDIFEEFRNVFDCEKTNDPIEQTAQSLLDIQVLKRYSSLKTSI
jgi:anthranilate synthase component 1